MRFKLSLTVVMLAGLLLIANCQGQPPTVVYIVLSPTPETLNEATQEATSEVTLEATSAPTVTPVTTTELTAEATTVTAAATRTPLPAGFPAPIRRQVQVAEQLFQGGRMFWVEQNREIWVMVVTGEGRGDWSVYSDTWVEGEPESDETLTPPDGMYQPVRGFGKLWRTVPNLRDQLGWAVSPEFGYVSDYEYNAGGTVDSNGVYTADAGYHILYSLYGEQFRFNEMNSTWQLGGG